jgi:hypothetical protein
VEPRIFICYRREDSSGHAGRLYDRLAEEFGTERLFMDVDAIPPGADFVRVIHDAVTSCDVFVALVGRSWSTLTNPQGRPRLEDPQDLVRVEIETALGNEVPVMPVLVQGAAMPSAQDLPASLARFTSRNALDLSDTRWVYDVSRVVDAIRRTAETRVAESAVSGTGSLATDIGANRSISSKSRWVGRLRRGLVRPPIWALAATGAVLVAGGVTAAVVLGGDRHPATTPAIGGVPSPGSVTHPSTAAPKLETGVGVIAFDPKTGVVVSATDVSLNGSGEPSIATGEGGVWVHDLANITHLEPSSGEVKAIISVGSGNQNPGNVAVGLRTVWAGNLRNVERVNPATDELLRHAGLNDVVSSTLYVAVGEGSAWALDTAGVVWRITGNGDVDASKDVTADGGGLAVGAGSVWVLDSLEGAVIQVDPESLRPINRFEVPGSVQRIAVIGGRVWVLDTGAGSVTSIDTSTGALGAPIRVGGQTTDLSAGLGSPWVTDQAGSLWRVDSVTSTATEFKIGGPLAAVAVDEGSGLVWSVVVNVL